MKRRILKLLINWYSECERMPAWLDRLVQRDRELVKYQQTLDSLSGHLRGEAGSWVKQPLVQSKSAERLPSPVFRSSGFRVMVAQPAIALTAITLLVVGVLYWPRPSNQSQIGEAVEVSPEQIQSLVAYGGATKKIAERVSFKTRRLAEVWGEGAQRLFVQQRETATGLADGIVSARSSLGQFLKESRASDQPVQGNSAEGE